MADDPLSKFTSTFRPSQAPAAPPRPALPPSLVPHVPHGREPYEAFANEVRARNVEIRCWRTGLSYSIGYSHMSGIVCEFITGESLMFEGNGYGFKVKGRGLREILLALNLHTCGFIQDFHPDYFLRPEPIDPKAPFVESIEVRVLYPPPPQSP
ncbi:MAG TPA: hypothetical protein VMH39_10430 [Gemmatimonadaceae bacterium]|nr:hypothetical protein [Gemmatimonadaceae bacterium]